MLTTVRETSNRPAPLDHVEYTLTLARRQRFPLSLTTLPPFSASQTSNSESAAIQLCKTLSLPPPTTLDNYLLTLPPTNLLIIILSSYGHGASPLGGRIFRRYLDSSSSMNFKGLKFCLLGLGSRDYTTFFNNPKVTVERLKEMGAELIPTPSFDVQNSLSPKCDNVGVADASIDGQDERIEKWLNYVVDEIVQKFEGREEKEVEGRGEILREAKRIYEEENGEEEVVKEEMKGVGMFGFLVVLIAIFALYIMKY
ncbi:hypothetical protein TL16_g08574 [Triparma laevis f. inornata]|uniref:Flavodoxin-like domain-containing protein n=1 Tax=Triparma laevis f. inornata TaxID=1714386 RepID=A0A9W7EJT3_9STRA|nr:hypothetical protein TL16_g08574 [Triparma laevis f. inornata]